MAETLPEQCALLARALLDGSVAADARDATIGILGAYHLGKVPGAAQQRDIGGPGIGEKRGQILPRGQELLGAAGGILDEMGAPGDHAIETAEPLAVEMKPEILVEGADAAEEVAAA